MSEYMRLSGAREQGESLSRSIGLNYVIGGTGVVIAGMVGVLGPAVLAAPLVRLAADHEEAQNLRVFNNRLIVGLGLNAQDVFDGDIKPRLPLPLDTWGPADRLPKETLADAIAIYRVSREGKVWRVGANSLDDHGLAEYMSANGDSASAGVVRPNGLDTTAAWMQALGAVGVGVSVVSFFKASRRGMTQS